MRFVLRMYSLGSGTLEGSVMTTENALINYCVVVTKTAYIAYASPKIVVLYRMEMRNCEIVSRLIDAVCPVHCENCRLSANSMRAAAMMLYS